MTAAPAREAAAACNALIDARRYQQALDLAVQATASSPDDANLHCIMARALLGLGRNFEAAEAAGRAVSLAPLWAYAHRLGAIAFIALAKERHRHAKSFLVPAVREAREAARMGPADPMNHLVLAEALAAGSQLAEADAAARRALELAPQLTDTWVMASFVAVKARNWRAAEVACRRALAIDPNNSAAKNNLGLALRGSGRWSLGAVAFEQAAVADPRSSAARDNIELIGFQYLSVFASVLLLPLLVAWPLFIAARLGVSRWLSHRPAPLRGIAFRIGLRVARSRRYRRRYERANASALRQGDTSLPPGGWTALGGPRWWTLGRPTRIFVLASATAVLFLLLMAGAGAVADQVAPGSTVATIVAVLCGLLGTGVIVVGAAAVKSAVRSGLARRRQG